MAGLVGRVLELLRRQLGRVDVIFVAVKEVQRLVVYMVGAATRAGIVWQER